jgi:hypothetical protein
MSTNITHKKSAVPGKSPEVSQLAFGEIAINTYDGVLYFKKDDGSGESIVPLSSSEAVTSAINIDGSGLPQFNPEITSDEIRSLIELSSTDNVAFNQVSTPTLQITGGTGTEGTLTWNNSDRTLDIEQGGVTLQLGQEMHMMVRNATGSTIGNGTFLGFTGVTVGSNRVMVDKFDTTTMDSHMLVGFATEDINNGVNGIVTSFGYVRGLDTRGTSASNMAVGDEDWSVGDLLYPHPTAPGKLTTVAPTSGFKASVGVITNRHSSQGEIFVRVTALDENAYATTGQGLLAETAFGWGDWSTGVDKEFVDGLGVDASTVNGLTVETAVPSGAVFTDTATTVVDTLTDTSTTSALSANQGKILKDFIDNINTLLASDEVTLDTLQEIVNFIQLNKGTLDTLGISNIAGLQTALDGKESAFAKNTAFNKDFGSAAGTVCEGDDGRLSDARTPLAHTHVKSDITDFNEADYATAAKVDEMEETQAITTITHAAAISQLQAQLASSMIFPD